MNVLRNDVFGPGGNVLFAADGDVRKGPVLLGIIQPVSNHEFVFDREADVLDLDVNLPARRLAEETRGTQMTRRSGADDVLQIRQRETRVDDVLDDHDIAPLDAAVEILEDLYLAGRLRARAVARDRHEIERGHSRELAREIGHEDKCALEDAHKVDAVGMIALDLLREGVDALLNVVGGDQDVHREVN